MIKIKSTKNKLKHLVVLTCIVTFLVGNSVVFADSEISINQGNMEGYLSIENEINESELMTYDEILERMIQDGISREDAIKSLGSTESLNNAKTLNGIGTNSIIAPQAISYTVRTAQVKVTSTYYVTINFYITVDSAHGAYYIKEVNNVSLNRSYNGQVKLFSGEIYYKQENRITIYYNINGDFYNKGTLSVSGGGQVGVGESAKLNFSVNYSSNYYAYIHNTGRIFYGNVNPY